MSEQINLAALVERVRRDLAPVLAAAGVRLTVEARPTVSFLPKNLRIIVYNLPSNAVKYRDPRRAPVVQLRRHRNETTVVLEVLEVPDNGLGLNPDQQSRLFGVFQRLHDHVEGSGIGLYMVKKMVENAGGTIAVQSQFGVGSTFIVSFPAP